MILETVRKDYDKAEEMYKKAINIVFPDPKNTEAGPYCNYAVFLKVQRSFFHANNKSYKDRT
jgi:hypothetical protein